MTNHEQILDVLRRANGGWVCTTVFDTMFIRDHRKRVSELVQEGHKIESEQCRGECGKSHNSNIYKRRLVGYFKASQEIAPPVDQRAVQDKTPVINDSVASQPRVHSGWSYYPPESSKACCPIAQASQGRMHAQGCKTQKQIHS